MDGYAGLDSPPPPGTYDYITFGPVPLRTSDLSPIIDLKMVLLWDIYRKNGLGLLDRKE